jgi:hypothetical protein
MLQAKTSFGEFTFGAAPRDLTTRLDMWIPMDRDKSSWLAQAGHLTGFDGLSTERTLELIPSSDCLSDKPKEPYLRSVS